jgi:F0F1-type ATP synthase assembly protein I
MGKAAAKAVTTTIDPVDAKIEQATSSLVAKQQFISSTFNMGWRLAITVVIPIVIGVKIDEHFKTAPAFTLLGLMLAVVAGSAAVWTTIKAVNKEQAESTLTKGITKRKVRS